MKPVVNVGIGNSIEKSIDRIVDDVSCSVSRQTFLTNRFEKSSNIGSRTYETIKRVYLLSGPFISECLCYVSKDKHVNLIVVMQSYHSYSARRCSNQTLKTPG